MSHAMEMLEVIVQGRQEGREHAVSETMLVSMLLDDWGDCGVVGVYNARE